MPRLGEPEKVGNVGVSKEGEGGCAKSNVNVLLCCTVELCRTCFVSGGSSSKTITLAWRFNSTLATRGVGLYDDRDEPH